MKYKILGIVTMIAVLLISIIASLSNDGLLGRTHQHLEYKEKDICDDSSDEFCTHLPIIKLDTDGQEMLLIDTEYENGLLGTIPLDVNGKVDVIDNDKTNNHLADNPTLSVLSNMRIRGNSSKWYDKSSYKLSFINDDGSENKEVGLLGMEPHDEWALHGPYLDRTMIRNYLCLNISGQIMPYTPDVRFCELFLNGKYKGIYVAMETVARGEGRVEISRYDEGDIMSSYLLTLNWYNDNPNNIEPFTSYTKMMDFNANMRIMYPAEKLTDKTKERITQQVSYYEKTLYSFDYRDVIYGYKSFYDVNSFIDYAIINEFFQNTDAGNVSTFFYKDIGEKMHIGPVWDFDGAFNNNVEPSPDFSVVHSARFNMLLKDEYFVEKLIERYFELRKSVLSEEYLFNYIDESVEFLGPAVDRNFEVWENSFDYENMQEDIKLTTEWRNPKNHDESVEDLKEFIKNRGSWLDEHIEILRHYSHESVTKKFNH